MELPDLARLDTLPKLLLHNAERHGQDVAMREKDLGIWNEYRWADVLGEVRAIALGLGALGVGRGEVVGADRPQSPELDLERVAVHALGGLSLGLYEDILADEAIYLLDLRPVPRRRLRGRGAGRQAGRTRRPAPHVCLDRLSRRPRHAEIRPTRASSPGPS